MHQSSACPQLPIIFWQPMHSNIKSELVMWLSAHIHKLRLWNFIQTHVFVSKGQIQSLVVNKLWHHFLVRFGKNNKHMMDRKSDGEKRKRAMKKCRRLGWNWILNTNCPQLASFLLPIPLNKWRSEFMGDHRINWFYLLASNYCTIICCHFPKLFNYQAAAGNIFVLD